MNIFKTNDYLLIASEKDEELSKIKALKKNAIISIKQLEDESAYYKLIEKVFDYVNKSKFTIKIYIRNRELFRKSGLIKRIPKNINLIIYCNYFEEANEYIVEEYNIEEYIKEEEIIEKMVGPIRDSNLSPFEKYLAVYDIVKKFKIYKDNETDSQASRNLKSILKDNNEYIVCLGYAKLLRELLNRIGIPNMCLGAKVDKSYKKGFTMENITINYNGHARNLVKIDDDKYDIHGYYLTDATWDNHPELDLFLHCLLTFDKLKESKYLEELRDEDLLLDFHSRDEFNEKINFYVKRKTSISKIDTKTAETMRIKCYRDLIIKILNILKGTDKTTYQELYNKYHKLLNIDVYKTNSVDLEQIMISFLKDYAKYIIPLSNNEVNLETVLKAMIEVKSKIYKMKTDEIKIWLSKALKDNTENYKKAFPYIYDPNNPTEAYLEARNNKR